MNTLSVIIITKDEADDIRRCLESIKWADEIIVLDSGSTDDTVNICREYTDKVFITDWLGFGIQKNRALSKATGDWVLSIDADEEVSVELAKEIKKAIDQNDFIAYNCRRISEYCGRKIKYGDWRSDNVVRLFKRDQGKFSDRIVHEKLIIDGSVGKLKNILHHYPFKNLTEVLNKLNSYSSATAQLYFENGKKISTLSALLHGFWAFFRGYILRAGLLDGREGFALALSNGLGTFYRYMKLIYLYRENKKYGNSNSY